MSKLDSSLSSTLAAGAAMAAATGVQAAATAAVDPLIAKIRTKDDAVRGPAWQGAAPHGAPAVKPLAEVMTDADFEIARSAKRALWVIVRHAGRPGAAREAAAVTKELVPLLTNRPTAVRREVLWMLSEIAGDSVVDAISPLLADAEIRDDARCALLRIPGRKVNAALKAAMARAPEEFKYALADSLRLRGENVKEYPSRKLVPTRTTTVKPAPATS